MVSVPRETIDKQSLSIASALDRIAAKIIEISFYALFFLTPLLMNQVNSELFELPKMFFVWAGATLVMAFWLIRMIANGKILFRRTFLDIFLLSYLVTQLLSYLFSIDRHTSLWGYYSRFNGGLAPNLSFLLLYWAFVSNLTISSTLYALRYLLISGLLVALWGIPAHFGYDPTCFVLGYGLNTNCWTAQFVPTVRIFSTLGQPNWLASWLVALVPISWALVLINGKDKWTNGLKSLRSSIRLIIYSSISLILLLALFYTRSQSGFAGLIVALAVFWVGLLVVFGQKALRSWHILSVAVVVIAALSGIVFSNKLLGVMSAVKTCTSIIFSKKPPIQFSDITPSWQIRCIVWKGAVRIWRSYPILGTGPETFAYSYYNFRPQEHNLTSEWDYLYNKAHNEYLNLAATTGTVGLGAYLVLIGAFLWWSIKIITNVKFQINTNYQFDIGYLKLVLIGIIAAYSSILVTNFFGFSVVPVQLQFFLYPAMAVVLLQPESAKNQPGSALNWWSTLGVVGVALIAGYLILKIGQYYLADIHYARAERLANQNELLSALPEIRKAIEIRQGEPLYQNELVNILSSLILFMPPGEATTSAQLAKLARQASDKAIETSPRNINFLRSRGTMFVRLATLDESNFERAAQTLEETVKLAPTEPKIAYNLGFLYLQTGKIDQAITHLSRATNLRPPYRDAWYALGLAHWENKERQKARDALNYILKNIGSDDKEVLDKLVEWEKSK